MPKVDKRETKRAMKNAEQKEVGVYVSPTSSNTTYFSEEFAPGKYVSYSSHNGRSLVHIREYTCFEGRLYPTKKGACFTPIRLKVLVEKFAELDEELKQLNSDEIYKVSKGSYRSHLGGGIYASVQAPFNGIDIRRYFIPEGMQTEVPTKNGIFIPNSQWAKLKIKLNEVISTNPELSLVETCFHQNQIGMIECRECSPFGWSALNSSA
jgi:hypothetical protein